MVAKGVRNMYSILVVFNKHNTARVASCWFIIYYTPDITLNILSAPCSHKMSNYVILKNRYIWVCLCCS